MEFRCKSDQRCVAITPDGPAVVQRETLCAPCIKQIQEHYDELPAILRVLPAWKGGLRGENGEAKVSSSKGEAPCPLNVGAVDLELDIASILESVGSLRIADLVNQDGGIWWAVRIHSAWQQADGLIGISRHWSPRFAKCPNCETRSLGNYAGSDVIQCAWCGSTMSRDDYLKHCFQT